MIFGEQVIPNVPDTACVLQGEMEGSLQLLRSKDGEVRDALARIESHETLNIDDAVDTTTPLYRQYATSCVKSQSF